LFSSLILVAHYRFIPVFSLCLVDKAVLGTLTITSYNRLLEYCVRATPTQPTSARSDFC